MTAIDGRIAPGCHAGGTGGGRNVRGGGPDGRRPGTAAPGYQARPSSAAGPTAVWSRPGSGLPAVPPALPAAVPALIRAASGSVRHSEADEPACHCIARLLLPRHHPVRRVRRRHPGDRLRRRGQGPDPADRRYPGGEGPGDSRHRDRLGAAGSRHPARGPGHRHRSPHDQLRQQPRIGWLRHSLHAHGMPPGRFR